MACFSSGSGSAKAKASASNNNNAHTTEIYKAVKQLERKHLVSMKPNLKHLALFEQYTNLPAKSVYTKAIGTVNANPIQGLPHRSNLAIMSLFNANLAESDIKNETELMRLRGVI